MSEEKKAQEEILEDIKEDASEKAESRNGSGTAGEERDTGADKSGRTEAADESAGEAEAVKDAAAQEDGGDEAGKDGAESAENGGEEPGDMSPDETGENEGEASAEEAPASREEKKALKKKEEELAQLKDRYMRTLAEYENFRKRTEKEKADLYAYAVKDVMTKILPVLDNLERGLMALPEESKEDPVAQGMDKIAKQFVKALDDMGVKPIEAEGKPFDPQLHNAVMHVDDEALAENIVAEELQKGYTYKDGVIRYSMVKVAN